MTEFDATNVKNETKTKIDQFIKYHLEVNNFNSLNFIIQMINLKF